MEKILFIGGGNMARALISGTFKNFEIFVAEHNETKRSAFIRDFETAQIFANVKEIPLEQWEKFSAVFLAIKPQQFEVAASEMPSNLSNLLVSIMAGIGVEKIHVFFSSAKIIRAMPNTPAFVQKAVVALFAGENVSQVDKKLTEKIFNASGKSFWVDEESQINAITALSGSGPAYVFYFLEAFQKSALALGFDKATARMLALETFGGALALAQTGDFRALRHQVTSRGGTTEAALAVLRDADFIHLIQNAVRAAHHRARELS